jgi:hypothetical protein
VGALGVLLARKKVARGKIFGPAAAGAFLTVERCGAVGWAVWGWRHAVGLGEGTQAARGQDNLNRFQIRTV